jgi:hypothetical protein
MIGQVGWINLYYLKMPPLGEVPLFLLVAIWVILIYSCEQFLKR